MTTISDSEFNSMATKLLDRGLVNCAWDSKIDKKRILTMYSEAKAIVQDASSHKKLSALAQALIDSMIRIVRCIAIEKEGAKLTEIKGRTVELEADFIFYNSDNEYKEMRQFAGKMKRHNRKPKNGFRGSKE
jgi:uncharacterized protein YktA (UPF0223 family)